MIQRALRLYRNAFSGLGRDVWLVSFVLLVNRAGTMVLPFISLYLTEDRGFSVTLAGRILAPQGGEVFHWDRFLLPCIAQVEYRLGDRSHIIATTALTPRTSRVTDLFATVAVRVPVPNAILQTVAKPVAMRILRQDMEILRRQTEQVERFGGEEFASTEIDVLGLRIKKLLREASSGKVSSIQEERRIKMLV